MASRRLVIAPGFKGQLVKSGQSSSREQSMITCSEAEITIWYSFS